MPFAVFFKSMPLDEVIFLLRGRLVLAPCVPFIEHEVSVIDEFLGVVEGSPAEFHGHDPISLSHSGCALLPRVRGEHVLARAAPAECRASRLRIKCSPGDQWARDPTRDAGQISETFFEPPEQTPGSTRRLINGSTEF